MTRRIVLFLLASLAVGSSARGADTEPPEPRPGLSRADLIARVMPSVVNISTLLREKEPLRRAAQEVGSFATIHGFGSGFVIDPSGLIVTNRHVVERAVRITVTLQDGETYPAHVLGRMTQADVALVRIDAAKALPALQWGDSDALRLGDRVIAIGNPLGIGASVSAGIVSGLNRDIRATPFDDFIQTDAAINHGNSGGPLFDVRGQVVGINTAIFSPSAESGSIGINFALPSAIAKFVVDETKQSGAVRAGWIGIQAQTVTPDMANALRLRGAHGAIILSLEPKGSAARAGLRPGDVILQIGEEQPADSRALLRTIAAAPLDRPVPLLVWRDGKTFTAEPIVGVLKSTPYPDFSAQARETPYQPGMTLAALNGPRRAQFKVAPSVQGVLVTNVEPYGPGDMRGIVPGDVIVTAGGHTVGAPADVRAAIAAARAQRLEYLLLLLTGAGGDRYVALPMLLGERPARDQAGAGKSG